MAGVTIRLRPSAYVQNANGGSVGLYTKQQVQEVLDALYEVIKAANEEARAKLAADVAETNYTDARPELKRYKQALLESVEAQQHAVNVVKRWTQAPEQVLS